MNGLLAESESLAVFAPFLPTKSLPNALGIIVCKECLSRPFANKKCKKKPEESGDKTRELQYLTCMPPNWLPIMYSKSCRSFYFYKNVPESTFSK